MEFSLSKYLTESLQSTILWKEILNEPGNYFKYMQSTDKNKYKINTFQHTAYTQSLNALKNIQRTIDSCFYSWSWPGEFFSRAENDKIDIIDNVTDEMLKKCNKQYNKYVQIYLKNIKHIFDSPDPKIFGDLVTNCDQRAYDTFNVTDIDFEKKSLKDIKSMKANDRKTWLYKNMDKTVFWFNANGVFMAMSQNGYIKRYSIQHSINLMKEFDIKSYGGIDTTPFAKTDYNTYAEHAVDERVLITRIRKQTLSDGTVLEWPILGEMEDRSYNYDYNSSDKIETRLNIDWRFSHREIGTNAVKTANWIMDSLNYHSKTYTLGDPTSKNANICKRIHWGKNPDDYCIIYTPSEFMSDGKGGTVSIPGKSSYYTPSSLMVAMEHYGFSNWKHRNDAAKQYENEYINSDDFNRYKWQTDAFGDIIPYSIDGYLYIWNIDSETGKFTAERVTNKEYYCDELCRQIKELNIARYNLNRTKVKYMPYINKYKKIITSLSDYIVENIKHMDTYSDKLQEYLNDNDMQNFVAFMALVKKAEEPFNTLLKTISYLRYMMEKTDSVINDKKDSSDEQHTNNITRHFKGMSDATKTVSEAAKSFEKYIEDIEKYTPIE